MLSNLLEQHTRVLGQVFGPKLAFFRIKSFLKHGDHAFPELRISRWYRYANVKRTSISYALRIGANAFPLSRPLDDDAIIDECLPNRVYL